MIFITKSSLRLDEDKWLSIEKTHVFPVKKIIHFGSIRIGLGVVLIIMIF